jgi:hypothetical protein
MEQQPGPVNWAALESRPSPGMVRLWTWEAFAHGAEVVSYFRWRQFPAGAGADARRGPPPPRRPPPRRGYNEVAQVARELQGFGRRRARPRAPWRLVFDYEVLSGLGDAAAGPRLRLFRLAFAALQRLPTRRAVGSTSAPTARRPVGIQGGAGAGPHAPQPTPSARRWGRSTASPSSGPAPTPRPRTCPFGSPSAPTSPAATSR